MKSKVFFGLFMLLLEARVCVCACRWVCVGVCVGVCGLCVCVCVCVYVCVCGLCARMCVFMRRTSGVPMWVRACVPHAWLS